ncbi:MAG: transketolase, partial [Nitrospiraceae bacterium]
EDQPDWHGKPLKKGEQTQKALDELTRQLKQTAAEPEIRRPEPWRAPVRQTKPMAPPAYKSTDSVATREAFGAALVALGEANPLVVAL